MKLIFIHGRQQEDFDAFELKQTWITTLNEGLAKNGLTLPDHVEIEFPYYGKLLKHITEERGLTADLSPQKRRKVSERTFKQQFLTELVENMEKNENIQRGFLNKESVQNMLKKLDRKNRLGEFAVKLFTKDVFLYLTDAAFQQTINDHVFSKFTTEPSVVVGHSMGSIVSYVLLRQHPELQVKKLITVGSPLGMSSVVKHLPQPLVMPSCVQNGWFNAFDEGDFVALNPLNPQNFPINTPIDNKGDVVNPTDNQHGIIGYLNDKEVAKQIYDALVLS